MAFDFTSFLVGAVAGFVVGGLVFTSTGKSVTSSVVGASGRRVSKYLEPK
jgi:hypothetical protein